MLKNSKRELIRINIFCALFAFLATFMLITEPGLFSAASGYTSWVTTENSLDPVDNDSGSVDSMEADKDPGSVEKMFAKWIVNMGVTISKALRGTANTNNGDTIDVSVTGIIMAKYTGKPNYFVFDLSDGNFYGVVGATIYYILRAVCMSMMFVIVLWNIIKTLFNGDTRSFSLMKEAIYSGIIILFLIYAMPLITDWFCNLRDSLAVLMFDGVSNALNVSGADDLTVTIEQPAYRNGISTAGGAFGSDKVEELKGIEAFAYQQYIDKPTFVNGFLFFGLCLIPIFYIVSYVRIAFQQAVLFGLFPLTHSFSPFCAAFR